MRIRLNEIMINYAERGLPQGKPLLFIHGFPFNHTMWEPQMKALPNEVRAVAFDLRGHGKSDVGDGQFTIDFLVDDLIALLDHLGIDRALLCGLSMGGYVALRTIERYPKRVRGLILCDTRAEADSNEGKAKRSSQIIAVKKDGVKPFAENFLKAVLAPSTFESQPKIVEKIRHMIEATSQRAIGGTLLALAARTSSLETLSSIDVPTLIMVGEHDALTPPDASRTMHEKIKGSRLEIIPGAAHVSNLENPEVFNRHLLNFVKLTDA